MFKIIYLYIYIIYLIIYYVLDVAVLEFPALVEWEFEENSE